MQDTTKAQEFFNQLAGKSIEAMAVWAETNQRLVREMVELSVGATKEGVTLYAELSRSAIDAIRHSQASTLRWQVGLKDASDPAAWYEKTVNEGVQYAQEAFQRAEANMQTLARTAERWQTTAEQAGKGLQESLAGAVSRLKTVCSGS